MQSASTAALQNASGEPAGGRGGIGEPPPPAADDGGCRRPARDGRSARGDGCGRGWAQQGEDHEPSCVSTVTEVTRCGAPSAGGGGGSAERAAAALAARPPCGEAATFSAAVVASSAGVAAPSSRNVDSILAAGPALERPRRRALPSPRHERAPHAGARRPPRPLVRGLPLRVGRRRVRRIRRRRPRRRRRRRRPVRRDVRLGVARARGGRVVGGGVVGGVGGIGGRGADGVGRRRVGAAGGLAPGRGRRRGASSSRSCAKSRRYGVRAPLGRSASNCCTCLLVIQLHHRAHRLRRSQIGGRAPYPRPARRAPSGSTARLASSGGRAVLRAVVRASPTSVNSDASICVLSFRSIGESAASDGERLTSMSHGLRFSSINTSNPTISKHELRWWQQRRVAATTGARRRSES